MTALLKAMGVTVWTLAAVGLLVIGGFIGFRALRIPRSPFPDSSPASTVTHPSAASSTVDRAPVPVAAPGPAPAAADRSVTPSHEAFDPLATHVRFREAVTRRDAAQVIAYGRQLDREGYASPADATQVALAFYAIGDCANARTWLARVSGPVGPAVARAESSCEHAPLPLTNPSPAWTNGVTGDRDIRVGELYYGFNDFPQAIGFLRKGLAEGGLSHPDDAYVYLGLSYLALDQYADACAAFDDLQQVESASPRVRRLWGLFADTHCRGVAASGR